MFQLGSFQCAMREPTCSSRAATKIPPRSSTNFASCSVSAPKNEALEALKARIAADPVLARATEVWGTIKGGFTLTPVGQAVAYSNAKRTHPLTGLPSLAEYLDGD